MDVNNFKYIPMLYAKYIIKGMWEYERVPESLKDLVDAELIKEGREDLIKRR